MSKRFFASFFLTVISVAAFAQAEVESAEVDRVYSAEMEQQYNPNSIDPIPKYEHHYKVRIWRTVDLKEKQNKGFFSNNGEITKLIIDAVRSGEITDVYKYDSLTSKLSKQDFTDKLVQSAAIQFDQWDPTRTWYVDERASYNGKNYISVVESTGKNPETSPDDWSPTSEGKAATYLPRDITTLRMVEDVIFDKRRSRLYYDIQAFQMVVPGAVTANNVDVELGWIKYKDLEKVFRNHPEKAVWFNRYNTAQNKNFADAFLLRLFHGVIEKTENPDDESIRDIYINNGKSYRESVFAREWEEMRLMEKEHNLWEF